MPVGEPEAAYHIKVSSSNNWNPNVPFHGTQEEWLEHFHRIEKGQFYPVSEAHQRISQWLEHRTWRIEHWQNSPHSQNPAINN